MNAKTQKPVIPEPPARKRRLQMDVPTPTFAPDNLSTPSDSGTAGFQDMNFKVNPAFHKRFRLEATLRGMTMKELLEASFKAYLETNGGTMEAPRRDLIPGLDGF